MSFASAWLERSSILPGLISEVPRRGTGLIAVVPSYNEPGITTLLDSLAACNKPGCEVEVIIVVNAPQDAPETDLETNRKTLADINAWEKDHPRCFFRMFAIDSTLLKTADWSVGLARKTGMDEAVRRFDTLGDGNGVIICLDADCTVGRNYFSELYEELYLKKERQGCSVYFEHPVHGTLYTERHYAAIIMYELHLRYYFQGLAYTGFPYVHHTVGSAIAVKSLSYIKAGGMNRRKAGEDFYFVQKLVQAGGYFNLNSTTVYPSPRSSVRVPFGTGATIKKLTENNGEILETYNVKAFMDLNTMFSMVLSGTLRVSSDQDALYGTLPASLKLFISKDEWVSKFSEIKGNTSGEISFVKRFFTWFNMFMIVKYMNMVHVSIYRKMPVYESASELLALMSDNFDKKDGLSLLRHFRHLEKTA